LRAWQIGRPERRLYAPCTATAVDVMGRQPRVDAVRVVPGLWLGAAPDRRQAQALTRDGIDAVVDLRTEVSETDEQWPPGVEVVRVGLEDHGSPTLEELRLAAQTTSDLMRRGREVLVHCHAGLERSPTVACATLILQGWPLNDAFRRVTEVRPRARPTDGQVAALRRLAAAIAGG
jgi:protein-tyrosine phosphatase